MDELKQAVRDVTREFNQAEANSPDFRRLQRSLAELKQVQGGVRAETRLLSKELELEKTEEAASGSLRSLELNYQKLRQQVKLLSREERESAFGRALVRQAKEAREELNDVNQSMGDFRTNVGNYQSAFTGLGNFLTGGFILGALATAASAIKNVTVEIFNQAVEVDTLSRKSLIVLGDEYDRVTQAAMENATALGLTTQEYVNQVAGISDILIPMQFQRDAAADIATELVNLSGALAEWSGGTQSAEDAQRALQGALTGEREQLKQFGIVLSEADITTRLAAKGLEDLTGAALQQAKAVATLELVTERSTDAQTSFAENSDSLIRTQARLTASYGTVREAIASALIPVFGSALQALEPFAQFLAERVPSALNFVLETFDPVFEAVSNFAAAITNANGETSLYSELLGDFARGSLTLIANVLAIIIDAGTSFIQFISSATDETGQFTEEAGFLQRTLVLLVTGLLQLPAVFNGIVEVVKNSGAIIRDFGQDALLTTQILFNDIKGIVSQAARDRAEELRRQRDEIRNNGVSVADAFNRGFNEAVARNQTPPVVNTATRTATNRSFQSLGEEAGKSFTDGIDTSSAERSPFEDLEQEAKDLKEEIENLAAAGQDYGDELTRLNSLTERLNTINGIFKQDAQDTEEQIKRTTDALETLNTLPISVDPNAQASPEVRNNRQRQQAFDQFNNDLRANPQDRARLEENLQRELTRIEREGQAERLQLSLDNDKLTISERIAAELELAEVKKDILSDQFAQEEENTQKLINLDKMRVDSVTQGLEIANEVANALGELSTAIEQRRINDITQSYDAQIEAAAGNEEEIARLTEERDARIEEVERAAFERNKRLAIAQALINGALAITNILATVPKFDFGVASALQVIAAGITTAAQVAAISSTTFSDRGNLIPVETMAEGGTVKMGEFMTGNAHNQGKRGNTGIRFMFGGKMVEAQNGEFIDYDEFGNAAIVNAHNSRKFSPELKSIAGVSFPGKSKLLSDINSWGGHGKTFAMSGALVPNITAATAGINGGSVPQTNIIVTQEISDEQFERLENTIGAAVERGAMAGTERGNINANREIERDGLVNSTINGL